MMSTKDHQDRSHRRSLLRKASRGDKAKFTELAEPYLDLITEYLFLSGLIREKELLDKTARILSEAWRFLPFLHSVRDFERLITTTLFSVPPEQKHCTSENRVLLALDSREKFALVANDLESWDKRWTSAALKVTRKELETLLTGLRCHLVSIDFSLLDEPNQKGVQRVSLELDDGSTAKEKQKFSQCLGRLPEAKEFKRRWLDYRCHLIEMRQQVRFSASIKEPFLIDLEKELSPAQMIRIPLLDRFVGRLSFRESTFSTSEEGKAC